MNRLLFSSFASASKCRHGAGSLSGARRHASSTGGSSASSSSTLASVFLGIGVVSAGGYYYLSQSSPQTIKKAENAIASATGIPVSGSTQVAGGALDPSKFVNFKLKEIKPYNHNTARYIFELPEGVDSGLTVASALLIKPAVEGQGLDKKGKPAVRPYTPVSQPSEKGHMDFLIKRYPDGALTQYMHNELKPGMEMSFKGPIPKHQWKANEFEHVGLIAGGTGITPMYQLLQAIDENPQDKTKATLLFANVSEDDILLKEAFADFQKRKPDQFKIEYVIEKPSKSWKGLSGYIGHDALAKNLPMPGHGDKIKIFVCGPPPLVEVVSGNKVKSDQGPLKGFLADIGYSPSQVYKF